MRRCDKLIDKGRRQFLGTGAIATVGAAATACAPTAQADANRATHAGGAVLSYPRVRLANMAELKLNEPHNVNYPDEAAPGVLLKLGQPVMGGAGPDGDVVGFSVLCPHQGYPLSYHAEDRSFNCPGHYSRFDAEAGGQQIWGQATQNLPQYLLRVDDKGDIYAEGVDELLYGRLSNTL
ncbi:arsenate reductase (azurin) small subunit [Parvularcula marina]|uniref:arsenate reductase (azurin) small subunit n=1 Tax=Parvularcula marina TaxID=2292771 RepID=UPI00351662FD